MKKGILCILLSLLLLAPMFASCQKTAVLEETEATVYTLYTIVDESTTEEAIIQVELALNRILFYRLGVILKLEMVTEDEYDKLIEDKFAEMEAYQIEKKNKNKNKTSSSEAEETETSEEIMTGDRIIELLEEGVDIELDEPRFDIFLVKGYDKYYELATQGKLAALDEKLNNEAKALKSSIHSTLFTAAKVNNKTFGVPVNTAIGEYTYLVFDQEYLDKYSIDPNSIASIEDLQNYLDIIKQNEPDVVPLKNTMASTEIDFLSNDGFPALILPTANDKKEIIDAYSNKDLLNYLAMIARYRALGYLGDETEEDDEDTRYAVRIETGNTDEISARLKDTDREYAYSLYSNPIATNENTIDNIFCVSEYVVSNELTDVMEILTELNTDTQLMNILTYGVENENYVIDDYGQIERLNDTYMIKPEHAGNCFITYTLQGENPDKWANDIKQNQDAVVSPSLGFTSSFTTFKYKETVEVESTEKPGEMVEEEIEIEINEPDYISIINEIVDEYYPALMNGTALDFNYDDIYSQAEAEVIAEFTAKLDELFAESTLKPYFNELMRQDIIKNRAQEVRKNAEEQTMQNHRKTAESSLRNDLKTQFKKDNPEATADEIDAYVEANLTDELIEARIYEKYTEEEIEQEIETNFNTLIEAEISIAVSQVIGTPAYEKKFDEVRATDAYQNNLAAMIEYDSASKIQDRIDLNIANLITAYTDEMIVKMDTAIGEAVEAFISENSEKLNLTREEILFTLGYLKEEEKEETEEGETSEEDTDEEGEGEGEGEEEEEIVYIEAYESWFDFAFQEKLAKVYYSIFGSPTAAA